MVPLLSGVLFVAGLVSERVGAEILAHALFWAGLFSGASQFSPAAVRALLRGRLGIGLLMTASAVGAVVLGYLEEAAALAFLFSISEALESRAMRQAKAKLGTLLSLVPRTATVLIGAESHEVPTRELDVGQLMLVKPGERIPTDGIVREGNGSVDASAITGESIPVTVQPGDDVMAGSINLSGSLKIEATAAGTDNTLTTIVGLVQQAQRQKGDRARLADRLARPLVPGVLLFAAAVALFGSLFGDPEVWITRALVVLVAASPCALAISVPLTVVAGVGAASRFGMLVKSGAAFERLGEIRHVAFDKTGTLTRREPTVAAVATAEGWNQAAVLDQAAALEAHSAHPLADAITRTASTTLQATEVSEQPGTGLTGRIEGVDVRVGSPRWLEPGELGASVDQMESDGMTVVVVHRGGIPIGAVGIRDELRPEAREAVTALREMGIGSTMLTGDHRRTAAALGSLAGIDTVHSELRPEDKSRLVQELSAAYPTAMIGDGINDAPALATAHVGIAMGTGGSDAAIESADVAFIGQDLRHIPRGLLHARHSRRIMDQNIILSLGIIITLLPLALFGVLGLAMVVLIHELAEVVVIANGLRAASVRLKPIT